MTSQKKILKALKKSDIHLDLLKYEILPFIEEKRMKINRAIDSINNLKLVLDILSDNETSMLYKYHCDPTNMYIVKKTRSKSKRFRKAVELVNEIKQTDDSNSLLEDFSKHLHVLVVNTYKAKYWRNSFWQQQNNLVF
jgi:hypothetical protein